MSILNPSPATITTPVLLDLSLSVIQSVLEAKISWLTTAYGKAEKRERLKAEQRVIYPAIFAGGTDYLTMFPDSHLGNFSYFEIPDGQEIEWNFRRPHSFESDFGLIFWYDFRVVAPLDPTGVTNENVKAEVLGVLGGNTFPGVRVQVNKIFDRSENIYRGYTLSEIDNQFLMRPYGGFRLEGRLSYSASCP